MITLYGMKLTQKGFTIYLTSATVEQLKKWKEADRIYPDIWRREKPDGYQRMPDPERYVKIADYIQGKLKVEETLFPNSIILNLRQKGSIDFDPFDAIEKDELPSTIQHGKIIINDEALPFFEVDGQHRIRGLIAAYEDAAKNKTPGLEFIKYYPVPLTIMEGLDRPTEAMQFVVINTTQKKVDPALVLRILHNRWKEKGDRLEFFLKGQAWRLRAIELSDLLNSDSVSPWCDKITASGDKSKGRVISDQNLVNTLELVYAKMEHEEIKHYLPLFWRAVQNTWKECTGENATRYSLQRTNGTFVMNGIFPFLYFISISIGGPNVKNFMEILKPVRKAYPPGFWIRGGQAKLYTSKGSQNELIHDILVSLVPKGNKLKMAKLSDLKMKLAKKVRGGKSEKIIDSIFKLMPLRLYHYFSSERLDKVNEGATGVYILYSYKKRKFYVGRSEKADLKVRLLQHLQNKEEDFNLFNYRLSKDPLESSKLECALYHFFPKEVLLNKEHPSILNEGKCPFC